MSNYLKNGSLDLIQTFYDHCIRERGPLKKFLETYYWADWEIFGVEEKNWKANILSRVIVIVATLRELLATDHLHLQYFFQIFISHCSRCNDVINFGENPLWGNFRPSTRSPLSLFSSFDDDICLKWSGISVRRSWNPQFWKKRLGEMSLPQLQFTQFFEIFKLIFQFFLKLNTFEMNGADVAVKPHFRKLHRGGH